MHSAGLRCCRSQTPLHRVQSATQRVGAPPGRGDEAETCRRWAVMREYKKEPAWPLFVCSLLIDSFRCVWLAVLATTWTSSGTALLEQLTSIDLHTTTSGAFNSLSSHVFNSARTKTPHQVSDDNNQLQQSASPRSHRARPTEPNGTCTPFLSFRLSCWSYLGHLPGRESN